MFFACAWKKYGYAGCDDSWLWSALFSNKPFPAPGAIMTTPNPLTPVCQPPCSPALLQMCTKTHADSMEHGGSVVRWLKLSVHALHFSLPLLSPRAVPHTPNSWRGEIVHSSKQGERDGEEGWLSVLPKRRKRETERRGEGGDGWVVLTLKTGRVWKRGADRQERRFRVEVKMAGWRRGLVVSEAELTTTENLHQRPETHRMFPA